MPAMVGGFGNYFVPVQIGAPDMAKETLSFITKSPSLNLGYYLAGLFEGDGHISMSTKDSKNQYSPRFNITFNLKDKPLADKLLSLIKYYSGIDSGGAAEPALIRIKHKENACVLTISNPEVLVFIVYLINGKLRGPKIQTIYKLIDWLNSSPAGTHLNIPKRALNKSSLSLDSWLSGFTDADGCFYIRFSGSAASTLNRKRRIACRFTLEQRMKDPKSKDTYENLFTDIAKFFQTNLNVRNQSVSNRQYYIISVSSLKSLPIITEYFLMHPLFSSKYLDYTDWEIASKYILSNTHYDNSEIILSLKSGMNNKRTKFNWDHLNNLS